jgi:hypothetical protein
MSILVAVRCTRDKDRILSIVKTHTLLYRQGDGYLEKAFKLHVFQGFRYIMGDKRSYSDFGRIERRGTV